MLTSQLEILTTSIDNDFGKLNKLQLNWKPDKQSWSIGQCLHHLIVSNEKYIPALQDVINGKHKNSFWQKVNPLTNYTGKEMIRTLGFVVVKKYKSPRIFLPTSSSVGGHIVSDFISHQQILLSLFEKLVNPIYSKTIISSPVAGLITLRLEDAMNLIIAHEQRHINQALKVKIKPEFPQ